nr:MAG TPA: hypothetical protein [Caudoviricetes sp.]
MTHTIRTDFGLCQHVCYTIDVRQKGTNPNT